MDARAQQRLYVLNHVLAGELTGEEAATFLRLSVRTVRRILARYRGPSGAAALVHGNAGRVPANRIDEPVRARLVGLAMTRYAGVNRAHLAGLPPVRRRRPKGHRLRRERMSQAGPAPPGRLAGATTREEANLVLADHVVRHNARCAVPPADPAPAWRALPADHPAEAIFCARHVRRVARDGTVTLAGQSLMVAGRDGLPGTGGRVEIQERVDGSRWVEIGDGFRPVAAAPERPSVLRQGPTPATPPWRPAPGMRGNHDPNHPWRRYAGARPR